MKISITEIAFSFTVIYFVSNYQSPCSKYETSVWAIWNRLVEVKVGFVVVLPGHVFL
jgi:hypothetical protein